MRDPDRYAAYGSRVAPAPPGTHGTRQRPGGGRRGTPFACPRHSGTGHARRHRAASLGSLLGAARLRMGLPSLSARGL
jgi:hypothetical protein